MPRIKYPYEFDPKKRRMARLYAKGRNFSIVLNITLPLLLLALLIYSNVGSQLALYSSNVAVFALILYVLMIIARFPVSLYFGYLYEHKYKLSRYTFPNWLKDYGKMIFLRLVVAVPVIYVFYLLLPLDYWFLYALAGYFFLLLIADALFPEIIIPMFYKLHSYKHKAHTRIFLRMLRKAGMKNIRGIYVADESKKSVKANAMFAGLGKSKRVILFDTLTDNFTDDEVETVLAHEAAHYIHKDTWRHIFLETGRILAVFLAIQYIFNYFSLNLADFSNLPTLLLSFYILNIISMPLENAYSRHREAQCDLFALNATKKWRAQISAEKRLADLALSESNPHFLKVIFFYSHPPVEERIKMCEDWAKKHGKK
jgi:STE24 endopeptidase